MILLPLIARGAMRLQRVLVMQPTTRRIDSGDWRHLCHPLSGTTPGAAGGLLPGGMGSIMVCRQGQSLDLRL